MAVRADTSGRPVSAAARKAANAPKVNPGSAGGAYLANMAKTSTPTQQRTVQKHVGRALKTTPNRSTPRAAAKPNTNWQMYNVPTSQRMPTPGSSSDISVIMQRSGSTDPSDPHNWKGIAAALAGSAGGGSAGGGGTYDSGGFSGGSSYGGGGGGVAPVAPTSFQTPSQAPPAVNTAPTAVTGTAAGSVGAPSGMNFQSVGAGGTFGQFDRMRNARTPRSGLSITPELLKRSAQARLGSM